MTAERGEGDFLSRWARRKAEARKEEEKPVAAPEPPAPEPDPAEPAPDLDSMTDEEALEHLGLPEPETMEKGDNFAAFMAKGVPERLRRRALRRMYRANPVYSIIDGLDDYCEDFTDAAVLVGKVTTSYQVGSGLKAHTDWLKAAAEKVEGAEGAEAAEGDAAREPAPKPAPKPAPEPSAGSVRPPETGRMQGQGAAAPDEATPDTAPETSPEPPAPEASADPESVASDSPSEAPSEPAAPRPRRRMVFRVAEDAPEGGGQ